MKKLFTLILIFAGFTAFSQEKTFETDFNTLLQSYFRDCYNDSTKVEVHQPVTGDDVKKDPCEIRTTVQNGAIHERCVNGRHMKIVYYHAEPRDFGRFLVWMEERRKNAK